MPPWGSKWLEHEANADTHQDGGAADARPSTSGRRPWFNVVQGIRRSLDVHLKSYYKVDNAYSSMMRFTSASDKLQALARGLTDTGLIDFCCVYLVHPGRGTFGVVALSGAGAELYPPLLTEAAGGVTSVNVFTRCVFQVQDSNWAVEDVVTSKAPWYYDCASAVNGFGLPQDGAWLRRVGMRSVLALPCMTGSEVVGVLAAASRQKTLDHLLLRKLEDLCYKVTPVVADAVSEHSTLLCSRRAASRYESISDFAHEVLGEMLNLDRAVAVSVAVGNGDCYAKGPAPCGRPSNTAGAHAARKGPAMAAATAAAAAAAPAAAHQAHQQQQQQVAASARATSCNGRVRKGEEHYDAAAAAAAAAAAGFSWTGPSPAPAAPPVAHAPVAAATSCTRKACRAAVDQPQADESISMPSLNLIDTCSVATSVLVVGCCGSDAADARSTGILPALVAPSDPSAQGNPLSLTLPLAPLALESQSQPQPQSPTECGALEASSGCNAVCTSSSDNASAAAAAAAAALTLSSEPMSRFHNASAQPPAPRAAQHAPRPQPLLCKGHAAQACGGSSAAVSSDRTTCRSNRSLSYLEFFSGTAGPRDLHDTLASGHSTRSPASAAAGPVPPSAIGPRARADHTAPAAPARLATPAVSSAAHDPAAAAAGASAGRNPGSSARTTESGDGFMLETLTTEELTSAPTGGYMISPSGASSQHTERHTIHRVAPIQASQGATAAAAAAAAAMAGSMATSTGATSGHARGSCGSVRLTADRSSNAMEASAAGTDAHLTWNTNTSFGYGFSNTTIATTAASCAIGPHTGKLTGLQGAGTSGIWNSNDGACGRREAGFARGCSAVEEVAELPTATDEGPALLGRWSRDSAAAAACVWNNEAAEAFAAAMRFTAAHPKAPSVRGACTGAGSSAAAASATAAAELAGLRFNATPAHGSLYGIRESGPVPSLAYSLEGSGSMSGDCSVAVMDLASGAGFILSSGLGMEAAQQQQQLRQAHSHSAQSQSPPSEKLGLIAEQQWLRCRAVRS